MKINVAAAQLPVEWNVVENVQAVESALQSAKADDLLVLPEGMISGYDDQLTGLRTLDQRAVSEAIEVVTELVRERNVHLVCGTLFPDDGNWSNAAIYFSPEGERSVYRKVNLATAERNKLIAGSELTIFSMRFGDGRLNVSPQLCREVRFPDQWHVSARRGAQIFVYLTYAANPLESMNVWRSHLVSRAAETQRYVIAANVAHSMSHCPTMIVSPRGEVIEEAFCSEAGTLRASIDTGDVKNWYVDQQRADVIEISYRTPGISVTSNL
jgi:predicted amidohydrolase